MFKTNTGKEIFYIFLWLIGIIILYGLVERYLLEPSHYETKVMHKKHQEEKKELPKKEPKVLQTPKHQILAVPKPVVKNEPQKVKIRTSTETPKAKVKEKIKHIHTVVKKTVQEKKKSTIRIKKPTQKSHQNHTKKVTKEKNVHIPKVPTLPKIPIPPKVPSVPDIPKVPKTPVVPSVPMPTIK